MSPTAGQYASTACLTKAAPGSIVSTVSSATASRSSSASSHYELPIVLIAWISACWSMPEPLRIEDIVDRSLRSIDQCSLVGVRDDRVLRGMLIKAMFDQHIRPRCKIV